MITVADSLSTYETEKHFFILTDGSKNTAKKFKNKFKNLKIVNKNFTYNSFNNRNFLTVSQLRQMIKKEIPNK